MPATVGNFNDLVQLSQDTLYDLGEGFVVGDSAASTVTFGLSNSGGQLALLGAQTTNQTIWLPSNSTLGTILTNVNLSAGTTSNNLSAVTFSNSNNVSFGLNGSTVTASVQVNLSAGTTSNNMSAWTYSNSNNVSFGLNGSTVTGSYAFNVSGGTTSNNLSAITFSNKNGISFGLNASTVTAVFGGLSNWQNGAPITSFGESTAFVSFQPVVVPYAMTVTNILMLASLSQGTASSASSGGYNQSVGIYTLTGTGTAGTLSQASSASTFVSWTSGGAYSSASGVGYRQMSVASWSLTPGPYMLAIAFASTVLSSISLTLYGTASLAAIGASGQGTALSSMAWAPGYSVSSVAALPASVGVSATASFIRTGASVFQQPWISFQGT
jgi:hypothetical protein